MRTIGLFLKQHESVIILLLVALFTLLTLPGISWGAPDIWHPDELIHRVILALNGEWRFDETNFDYPSLPKYVMYGLGLLVDRLGTTTFEFILAARTLSVVLGALVIVLVYRTTRRLSGKLFPGILAALLLLTNHQFSLNARWAHNDLYVTLFVTLAVYLLLRFSQSKGKLWLYGSFFTVGLAASSKYNGGSLIIAPILIYVLNQMNQPRKKYLEILETLFVGIGLCFIGYAIGTPKSALWLAYYLKRVIPAIQRHSTYARGPDSPMGVLGQWRVLRSLQGWTLYIWGIFSFIVMTARLTKQRLEKSSQDSAQMGKVVVLVSILALDLPILFSYNLQERFFLPMLPLLVMISAVIFQETLEFFSNKGYRFGKIALSLALVAILFFNLLKVTSVTLLLLNDSRKAASAYLATLPQGTRIEYTLYPPSVPEDHFSAAHSYPLFFLKFPDDELPVSPFYEFNVGGAGVEDRKPDYLILDSFTYNRFNNPYTCSLHPEDCEYFKHLRSGQTNYELIKEFSYKLPGFLPDPEVSFVNPDLEIFKRGER